MTHRTTPDGRRVRRRAARRRLAGGRALLVLAVLAAGAVTAPAVWAAGATPPAPSSVPVAAVTARAAGAAAQVRDEAHPARGRAEVLARAAAAADRASSASTSATRTAATSSTAPATTSPTTASVSVRRTAVAGGSTSLSASPRGTLRKERRPTTVSTAPASTAPASTAPASTAPASTAPASSPSATGASAGSGPLAGARFWVDPDSDARKELARGADPALARIADAPGTVWLGDWVPTGQARALTAAVVDRAAATGAVPVLALYAVPGRDCGGYSSGGLGSPAAYGEWVRAVAGGIGDRRVVVVLEPDALAQVDCLSGGARAERTAMLRDAVGVLAGTGAVTYLDAGNSSWVDAGTMAQRLRDAGVAQARGFALNTSNFNRTADEEAYGERLSALLGGSRYVVDTSRNGNGPASGAESWCNPAGRALGAPATTSTSGAHADAYLWVKRVGESDGGCGRGEPSAGTWWPAYATGLAQRAR